MTGRIGYAVSRFPLTTETFVLREMLELEHRGWEIDLYAIIHERRQLVHPEARDFDNRGQYLQTLHPATLRANAKALARQPRRYASLLGRTIVGNVPSPGFLLRGLAIFPGTVELADRMRRREIQHIHAHFGTHAALLAMNAAELNDIGFSFTVHAVDLYVDTTMLAEKVRKARFVATISEFNRRRLIDLAGAESAAKIHIVRCGVDVESYRPTIETHPSDPFRVIAVGSLRDYKGHEYLIRACRHLHDVHPDHRFECRIIGEGALRQHLERLISELGVQGLVTLVGAKDQAQVLDAMRESDLLVMPSVIAENGLMEGLPVTLMEAMAVRLPVIATDISGIPELVISDETGLLVPPGDARALSEAMAQVMVDYGAAQWRAARGRTLVEQEYSLKRNVSRLESLFDGVLASEKEAAIS